MIRTLLLATTMIVLILTPSAWGQQTTEYYRVHPLTGQPALGRIGDITKDKVTIVSSSVTKEFPVNEIKFVQLSNEPRELTEARIQALEGHYEQALTMLDKIPPPQLANEFVRQDSDYYRALCTARLAMNRVGDAASAGTALVTMINANKNSHHFYEANEAVGDLLSAMGRNEQAIRFYSELASAPWPEYKMRAAVAIGRALQAQGKHNEALQQFDAAIGQDSKGKAAEAQLLAAKLGKGKSLVELGRAKEGLACLSSAIDDVPPENNQLGAQAYNTLGTAYLKLNQPKDALYAYLHVDLLYNQLPDQHAEALFHLKELWKQLNQPERAKNAADRLKSRYAASQWNK